MGRRDKGTGSIYQRKDGSWVAQFEGTYRYAKTEKEAKEKLRTLLRQAHEVKPSNITLETVLEDYLHSARQTLKPRTVIRYQQVIEKHLKPALGTVRLHNLTALQIEDVYARKLQDLSAATLQLTHVVLSAAVKRAVRLGLVQTNVCSNVQTPRIARDEVEVFHPSDVQRILSAAKYEPLWALWTLALHTGMREGELLGLYVGDYDTERGRLSIRRTVYNGAIGTPKYRRSRRTIKLPRLAQDVLERHIENMSGDTWMFPNSKGNPIWLSSFLRQWKALLERAGVQYKNFHTCRHYVASTLLGKGLPITAVARYLGHDEKTLLSTYAHLMPDMMDAVAAAMDESHV